MEFDWSQIRLFVAVAEEGSLSAASRKIGVSQPTIGRAVQALEEDLGVSLFSRHTKGLRLTSQGDELLVYAREMAQSAAKLSLAAAGRADRLDGSVRISASQIFATYILPPVLARLRKVEPRIQVEVVATDVIENLLFREADIAIRMVRPQQLDLVTKHVADMPLGIFASHAYLANRPAPYSMEDLALHSVIGYDRSTLIIDGAAEHGLHLDRDFFSYRCDDQVVCWNLLLSGVGIGFAPLWLAQSDDRVERLLADIPLPSLPVWLTSHPVMKTNQRVRFVYNFLSHEIEKMR